MASYRDQLRAAYMASPCTQISTLMEGIRNSILAGEHSEGVHLCKVESKAVAIALVEDLEKEQVPAQIHVQENDIYVKVDIKALMGDPSEIAQFSLIFSSVYTLKVVRKVENALRAQGLAPIVDRMKDGNRRIIFDVVGASTRMDVSLRCISNISNKMAFQFLAGSRHVGAETTCLLVQKGFRILRLTNPTESDEIALLINI